MTKLPYASWLFRSPSGVAVCAAFVSAAVAIAASVDDGEKPGAVSQPEAAPALAASALQRPVLADFALAPAYPFLSWEKKVAPVTGGLRVQAVDARGGLTVALATNLTAFADWTPRLAVTIGPSNKLSVLSIQLSDADGTKYTYRFWLERLPAGHTNVLPGGCGSLQDSAQQAEPGKTPGLDLAHLTQMGVLGTWLSETVDLQLEALELAPPDAVILKAREQQRLQAIRETEQKRKAAEAEAKRKVDFLAGAPHPADGAQVLHVGAVAPDILGIDIQSGTYRPGARVPYEARTNDTLASGSKAWVVRDGKMIEEIVGQTVQRKDAKGKSTILGVRSFDGQWLLEGDRIAGTPLEPATIGEAAAYEIRSTDDPAYATPVTPATVYRKSKPNSPASGQGGIAIRHRLYLKLPAPLQEGASYTVRFKGLNTCQENVTYQHDTRSARSEAVHVTHVGYRPDDPFKRGYLSVWLGTGGSHPYTNVDAFELVDADTGKAVFHGKAEMATAGSAAVDPRKDYAQTTVCWLDFSGFRAPGTYRLRVPGIGASYPFVIGENVWQDAFKLGMRGVLSQRSGIALGPPFLDFKRPRPCHPDDGVKFYQTDINISAGQEGPRGEALLRLWRANGKLEEVKGLWGGYQDAGDWDVYTTSLSTADELTEAFDISPEFGTRLKLSLPPEEAGNRIPDLLDEALWGLAAFRRLQLPNGAVRDGFGDGWGARSCDVSWDDSNPVCVYAASTGTTWLYASIAARMARLLAPYDAVQAREYGESAVKAWKWAEAQAVSATAATAVADRKDRAWLRNHGKEAAAAVSLYKLTREAAYHERFKEICEILEPTDTTYKGGWIEPVQQPEATFQYARLPDDLADPVLKKNARDLYVLGGNVAVQYMQGNPFNLATVNPGYPMGEFCAYFTMPGMGAEIVRAHALTGDPRYLAAIVASTGFGLGANPENMAFTTGLGPDPIRFPLKLDSLRTGQPAPAGITVYGPSDQHKPSDMSGWVYTWVLTPTRMVPDAHTWPASESYADIFAWAGANEYCVNVPLTEAVCTWYYLAARP